MGTAAPGCSGTLAKEPLFYMHVEFMPRARGQVQVHGVTAKSFCVGCSMAGEKDV